MSFYNRLIRPRILEALADTPVVLISGPRQAGKTTLAKQFLTDHRKFITLDDTSALLAARQDPVGMVRNHEFVIIDEVQRAPMLLPAIKKSVDEDRRPGRFLLTGSANLMLLPTVAESLAGRMETLTLLPLAGCELRSGEGKWLDAVYQGRIPNTQHPEVGEKLLEQVLRGGYPEMISRATPRRRSAWAKQYIHALIQRDVRDIASLENLGHLPRLISSLAHMSGRLCNFTQLGGQISLDRKTAGKYLATLEQMYLIRSVEPWFANRLSRIIKAPRIQFLDSGLLSTLTGLNESTAPRNRPLLGRVLESYVYGELLKQSGWAEGDYSLYTYRDKDQLEVDFVVEDAAGQVAGIEVKAAASVQASDLKGLRRLSALAGSKFNAGILLYDGPETLSLGDRLWAVPLSTFWTA